jgi:putative peptide zinc metalloprotease protein
MGVMLILLAPLPYMDATSSWGFRSRVQRLMVGASGVVCELAVAAVAALIWAHTAPGLINSLAYNVIFVASVTTLLFNLNPLMRFDGYHMLVDWLDVPNLYQRSREQLKYLGKRFVLRIQQAKPAARTPTEAWLLPLYGAISIAYWLVLMASIIVYVAEQYLDLGVAMALLMFVMAVVVPLLKFGRYLLTDPGLYHQRARALMMTLALCAGVTGLLAWVPIPDRIRVLGVIQATQFRELHIEGVGEVVEIVATPGQWVKAGEPLVRLQNPQLEFEIQSTLQQRQQLQAQELHAITSAIANLETLRKQRSVIDQKLLELAAQQRALEVLAPIDGIWIVSELDLARGQWLSRGAGLGVLIDDRDWRFVAVLPQFGTHLFEGGLLSADIRIKGQQTINLVATKTEVMPFERRDCRTPQRS